MIGFDTIGKLGRLGNQMFQYAALQGIAKHRGFEFMIPDHSMFTDYNGREYHELLNCFKMTNLKHRGYINGGKDGPHRNYYLGNVADVGVNSYTFQETFFNSCPDNHSIIGYFESEKYFKNVEKEIREDYKFKDEIYFKCLEYFRTHLDYSPKLVAVSIRRGDFLIYSDERPLCSLQYYKENMEKFDEVYFVVFSDDIEWCKQQDIFKGGNIKFIDDTLGQPKAYTDLCLMTMCTDYILSNSTFAWWGAWLSENPNKRVIAPKQWFGPKLKHLDTKDLYPESWEVTYPPKHSIIIPTYNHCDDLLKPCTESIIKNTDLSNVEVIIVANGCTDNTKEFVKTLPKEFKTIWFDNPLGFTKATNEGIKESRGEFITFLNNDCVLLHQNKNYWLDILMEPFNKDPMMGCTGAYDLGGYIMFFCAMTKKSLLEKYNLLDEVFSPGSGEDADYCFKLRKDGYKILQVPGADLGQDHFNKVSICLFPIWHPGGITFKDIVWDFGVKNKQILNQRYSDFSNQVMKIIKT